MKKVYFMSLMVLALVLTGTNAYARSWRVNSNPEAKANYLSVVAAQVDEKNVRAGDTLYLEPGHVEGGFTLNRKLHLIGPGFGDESVLTNTVHSSKATITGTLTIGVSNSSITGCTVAGISTGYNLTQNLIERCLILGGASISSTNSSIINCFIKGPADLGEYCTLKGNIVLGQVYIRGVAIISNNSIIYWDSSNSNSYAVSTVSGTCNTATITNNVIVNTNEGNQYYPAADSTHFFRNNVINFNTLNGSTIHHNVLAMEAKYAKNYPNMNTHVDLKVSDLFMLTGTEEQQYLPKPGCPSFGAGVGGADCGAHGGLAPYVIGGYPRNLPVVYDVKVADTPSNGTLPVQLKIRTQNE